MIEWFKLLFGKQRERIEPIKWKAQYRYYRPEQGDNSVIHFGRHPMGEFEIVEEDKKDGTYLLFYPRNHLHKPAELFDKLTDAKNAAQSHLQSDKSDKA